MRSPLEYSFYTPLQVPRRHDTCPIRCPCAKTHCIWCSKSFSSRFIYLKVLPMVRSNVCMEVHACGLLHDLRQPPRISKVVAMLVLCTWWLDLPKHEAQPYQVLEFFSGVGRIAALAKHCGFKTAAVDMEYGDSYVKKAKKRGKRSPMDLNSSAGLVYQVCISVFVFSQTCELVR